MNQIVRKNYVIGIETRKNLFILAQSIGNGTVVFFNCFGKNPDEFKDIDLEKLEILSCITTANLFFKKCNLMKLKIKPRLDLVDYNKTEHLAFGFTEWKKYVIYKKTVDEMEIEIRCGDLRLVNWKFETIKNLDINKDKNIIKKYVLNTMGVYGELNERLYLSYVFGKFVESIKELIIGAKIPLEYKTYYEIIMQKITKNEWEKLVI